jgi:hypothetical protein
MAEDLLDRWVRLITPIFPPNAWIVSRFSENNYIIQIDWKLGNDPQRRNKRSKKIQIIIKEDAIEDYLDKNKQNRESYNIILKQSIFERYNRFNPDNDALTIKSIPAETWLVSKDFLNTVTNQYNLYKL